MSHIHYPKLCKHYHVVQILERVELMRNQTEEIAAQLKTRNFIRSSEIFKFHAESSH
jgi:hypothetical protein